MVIDGRATHRADRPVTAHDGEAGYVRIRRERSPTEMITERDWELIKMVHENRQRGQESHFPGC